MKLSAIVIAVTLVSAGNASGREPLRLYAAGSLRRAMTEVAQAYTAASAQAITTVFGASGLLRERIAKGEGADVFASADVGNAQQLAQEGRAAPPVFFARNRLCALIAPGIDVTTETLLEHMLEPRLRIGTSTPKADPSGDYTWQLFEKAEKLRASTYATLDGKALKLNRRCRLSATPGRPLGLRHAGH